MKTKEEIYKKINELRFEKRCQIKSLNTIKVISIDEQMKMLFWVLKGDEEIRDINYTWKKYFIKKPIRFYAPRNKITF